jgi:thiamine kinase-like enzyme
MVKNLRGLKMTDASNEFAVFMDTAKMKALFQKELPDCMAGNWTLTECEIQHPRYKTYLNPKSRDKSFLALAYHLKGVNQQTNSPDDRILYAKAYLGERSHNEYAKVCSDALNFDKNAVLHLDKYGLVGWFFPYDPALPWLYKVLDKNRAQKYLSEFLLLEQQSPSPVIRDVEIKIINYRPEIRCTYRYEFQRLAGRKKTIFGKTFVDDKGAEIHRRTVILSQHSRLNVESFVIPPSLGYDATLKTLWLEGLSGQPLVDLININNADGLINKIAGNLLDFHHVQISDLDSITEDDLLAEIQKKVMKLQLAFGDLSPRFVALINQLKREKPNLPSIANRLSHGDFHLQQLLLMQDNQVALFDFDELVLANPLMDIANFCADIVTLELGAELTEKIMSQFFDTYKKLSNDALNQNHFYWHLHIQLLTRAYRAYIQQKPELKKQVMRYLTTAEAMTFVQNVDKKNVQNII